MKFFSLEEMTKSATAKRLGIDNSPSPEIENNLVRLIETVLDPIRERYGSPIRVSSGYRCKKLNDVVKGSKTSQHMKGEAADLVPIDGDTRRLFYLIKEMIDNKEISCGQLIWEYGTKKAPQWIHISLETDRKRNQILYIGVK